MSAILWVIIGILTSIIFWEIINYIYELKKAQTNMKEQVENDPTITQDIDQALGAGANVTQQMVIGVTQNRQVPGMQEQTRRNIKEQIDKKTRGPLERYLNTKLTSKSFIRVSVIDLGTIGFGIAVSFLALLNQGYVTNIRVIGPIEVLALVGLGLGIGSLREIVKKDPQ